MDWESLQWFLLRYPVYVRYSISADFTAVVLDTLTLMKFSPAQMSRQLAILRVIGLVRPEFFNYIHDYVLSNLSSIKHMKYFPNLYLWCSRLRRNPEIRKACYNHLATLSNSGELGQMEVIDLLNWFTLAN